MITLLVANQEAEHRTWVADIKPDGILGLDFMKNHGCQLIKEDGGYRLTMRGADRKIQTHLATHTQVHSVTPSVYRMAIERSTVLPPGKQVDVLDRTRLIDICDTDELGVLEVYPRGSSQTRSS